MSPTIRGFVERRLLVNYRVDLETLDKALPAPFRAREVGDTREGMGSVCFTQVEDARPSLFPSGMGTTVEAVTHRVSAELRLEGEPTAEHCFYVPQREVSSRLQAIVGRRLLPTKMEQAEITTEENGDGCLVLVEDGIEKVGFEVRETDTDEVDEDSVFYSVESARVFLCEGGVEYSRSGGSYGGLNCCQDGGEMVPVEVTRARSSYFEKMGGVLDSAFVIAETEHEWQPDRPVPAP